MALKDDKQEKEKEAPNNKKEDKVKKAKEKKETYTEEVISEVEAAMILVMLFSWIWTNWILPLL